MAWYQFMAMTDRYKLLYTKRSLSIGAKTLSKNSQTLMMKMLVITKRKRKFRQARIKTRTLRVKITKASSKLWELLTICFP